MLPATYHEDMVLKHLTPIFITTCLLTVAQAAMAQTEIESLDADMTPWISILLAMLLLILIGLGSFKSGKRTHLD